MNLGEILRNLLTEMDITQKQLAESLNIGVSTLGNYIQNNREPDYKILKALADFFDVSTDYLLDHRTHRSESHNEDDLLRVYRALNKDQQELLLKQGRLLVAHYGKPGKLQEIKAAEKSDGYKGDGAK